MLQHILKIEVATIIQRLRVAFFSFRLLIFLKIISAILHENLYQNAGFLSNLKI